MLIKLKKHLSQHKIEHYLRKSAPPYSMLKLTAIRKISATKKPYKKLYYSKLNWKIREQNFTQKKQKIEIFALKKAQIFRFLIEKWDFFKAKKGAF